MDYRLSLMCGTPIAVPECQLTVHQPQIQEIAFIGEQDFFVGAQCLCLNKTMFIEDKEVLSTTNNFQIFMMIMKEKEAKDKKDATMKVLRLLFPDYKVLLTPAAIAFNKDDNSIVIDENNFEILQEVLKLIFCSSSGPMDQQAFNPGDKKAQEIAQKLMRGRQRIAAEKASSVGSIFSQYLSVLSVGLHTTPTELQKLTMFQLYDLIERYSLYLSWDVDIKSRLAGANPGKEVDNWMKNIHN